MGFSRQEYWHGLPFPPPGDLPNPEIEPVSPESPALAGRFFTIEPPRKPYCIPDPALSDSHALSDCCYTLMFHKRALRPKQSNSEDIDSYMLEEFDPEKHGSKARVHLCEAEGLLLCEMLRGEADCLEWRPSSVPPSAFVRMLGKPVFSVGPTEP